jgi:hypothetical protein
MSAFMVSDRHIAYLVLAYRRYHARPGRGITVMSHELAEMARVLKAECARSIECRYPKGRLLCPSCGAYVCDPAVGYDPARGVKWLLPTPPPVSWRPGVAAPCPFAKVEIPDNDTMAITPIGAIKLVESYQYQASEHEDWDGSHAKRITDLIKSEAITCLEGYEAAPWSIA